MKVGDRIIYKRCGLNSEATVIKIARHYDWVNRRNQTYVTLDDGAGERYIGELEVLIAAATKSKPAEPATVTVAKKDIQKQIVILNGKITRMRMTLIRNIEKYNELLKKNPEGHERLYMHSLKGNAKQARLRLESAERELEELMKMEIE